MISTLFFRSLLPEVIIAGTATVIMLLIALRRMYRVSLAVTLAGMAAAFVVIAAGGEGAKVATDTASLFIFDSTQRILGGLILLVNILSALLSYRYYRDYADNREEFHMLLLLSTLGGLVLVSSIHFISFVLGLELLSIPLYALLGYVRQHDLPMEASTKYFVLTAVASAVVVFGFGLIYYQTGTMSLLVLAQRLAVHVDPLTAAGIGLVLAGLAFKLAVFPFHMWAADVYEGSPLPSTAVIATASKIAVFAFLYRFLGPLLTSTSSARPHSLVIAVTVLSIASMLGGNLLALVQTNVKRLLAYSSTAHLGYLLIPIATGTPNASRSAFFYLCIYAVTTLGAFAALTSLSSSSKEAVHIDDYRGLLYRRPVVSVTLIVMILSLAGLPISAGFFGKLYLFQVSINGGSLALAGVFVASSVIGLYYYLRLAFVQVSRAEPGATVVQPVKSAMDPGTFVALAVTVVLILAAGVYPSPLFSLLSSVH